MDILWSMFSFSAPKIMQIKLGYNEIPRTMLRKQVCYKEITLNRKEEKGRNMVKVSEPGLHGSLECRIWTTEMYNKQLLPKALNNERPTEHSSSIPLV